MNMTLMKKFKCVHCGIVLECKNGVCPLSCKCGKVKVNGQYLIEGQLGRDVVDVSPQLLQE